MENKTFSTSQDTKNVLSGKRLKALRLSMPNKLSMEMLASMVSEHGGEISTKTLSRYENGTKITEKNARVLASVFGCRPEYILMDDDYKTEADYRKHLRKERERKGEIVSSAFLFETVKDFMNCTEYRVEPNDYPPFFDSENFMDVLDGNEQGDYYCFLNELTAENCSDAKELAAKFIQDPKAYKITRYGNVVGYASYQDVMQIRGRLFDFLDFVEFQIGQLCKGESDNG